MATNRIKIFDTTLRDGEQAPGYSMNISEKIRLALALEALGVDIIEAGFAISSDSDFESVKQVSQNIQNATVASLARSTDKDISCAWDAVRVAKHPRIHIFLATSDIHLKCKLKMSKEEALEKIQRAVRYATSLCPDVEFSLEDATRTDLDYMVKVVQCAVDNGAKTINLPDTVGYSTPTEIQKMVKKVLTEVKMGEAVISMHCHNDLGLGVANTLSGLSAGARQAECTLLGIGERAGNASLEEIVMASKTRNDIYPFETGIKTEKLVSTCELLSSITGVKIFPSKAIVGINAFAHESGIHQHGMMANQATYEIMRPESVGRLKTNLVLGKHSGRHAFEKRLEELGFTVSKENLDALFSEFKSLADKKKTISDKDIIALCKHIGGKKSDMDWSLEDFVVNSGNKMTSTALITLKRDGKLYKEVSCGTGPIYAALRTVEKIIKHQFSLEEYSLEAVTAHRDALGEVFVKISDKTGTYRGNGVSTDIIEASILACLDALNKMLSKEGLLETSLNSFDSFTSPSDMLAAHTDKGKEW